MKPQKQFIRAFPDIGVLSAWREGVAEAAQNPNLKQQLLQREGELLPRFAEQYKKLKASPRRVRRSLQRKWKQPLAGVALLLALGQVPALAATINVGGGCSLAAAIRAANTDSTQDGCPAGNVADTIVLPQDSKQTLRRVLNETFGPTGLPVIRSKITIRGRDSTIRRADGADAFRILAVSNQGNLTLRRTTVTGGELGAGIGDGRQNGAGIFNAGRLTIANGTISENTAYDGGGVYSRGKLTVTNSTIADNTSGHAGGGLFNKRTVVVTRSTISGNEAPDAGSGVESLGSLTIKNSTISNNSGANFGGGVRSSGRGTIANSTISGNEAAEAGGGVSNSDALTIINSTISDNNTAYAGGGVANFDALTITNSTISGNTASMTGFDGTTVGDGGGVNNGYRATLKLFRTLISGNTAVSGSEIHNDSSSDGTKIGKIKRSNFNLFGHNGLTTAKALFNFTPRATDITATSDCTGPGCIPTALADILDTDLEDNGGPTQTHALKKRSSPAVDAVMDGSCPPPRRDQRGIQRPQDGNGDKAAFCDIGAFERRPDE